MKSTFYLKVQWKLDLYNRRANYFMSKNSLKYNYWMSKLAMEIGMLAGT